MATIDLSQGLRPNNGGASYSPASMGADGSDNAAPSGLAGKGQNPEQGGQPSQTEGTSPSNSLALTERDLALVQALKKTDTEVRAHEMAHIAAGGQYITSGARLEYQRGPDGVSYAVAGEVSIDTSPVPGDPKATAQKMQKIKAAALAPASPSAQDRKVAASATALAAKAAADIMALGTAQGNNSANADAAVSQNSASAAYDPMATDPASRGIHVDISA